MASSSMALLVALMAGVAVSAARHAGNPLFSTPATGIAIGCACALNGHAAAALPRTLRNSRRLMCAPWLRRWHRIGEGQRYGRGWNRPGVASLLDLDGKVCASTMIAARRGADTYALF